MSPAIKRDMRCHSALDPIIGYIKNDHQMNSNSFARPQGDSINAVLAAADYNSGLLLN